MMGSPHPKARRAASQEAWPAGLQTFANVKGGPQYLGATFNKFGAEMAYFRQPWACAGMMCSTVAVRQLISTFSSLQIILGLRRLRIGIIVWPRCGRTSRARLKLATERNPNVQTLFDATLRQQLQGPPCAGVS
jgi:hypothetical protein